MTIDITPEAVERLAHYDDLGGCAFRFAPILRALSAALTDFQKGQTYRYIGKDGLPILARDLEDQRDAAIAALTASQAETAAAYEVAAVSLLECCVWCDSQKRADDGWRNGVTDARKHHAARIRELTSVNSKAALDRMIAEARADGMREAAAIVDSKYAKGEMGNPGHHIIAAIPKGKDHE